MKRILLSFGFGILVTIGITTLARLPSPGPGIITYVLLPFYLAGAYVSGNVHAPNELVAYGTMVTFFSFVFYVVAALYIAGKQG